MSAYGYQRTKKKGKYRYKHDEVWEKFYGTIPDGMVIHHIDGNKKNNEISNLRLVTIQEHSWIHAGYIQRDDVWLKQCPCCGKIKEINSDYWYFNKRTNGVIGVCKECYKEKVRKYKLQKRQSKAIAF